jgi:alpha-mannosidase
MKMKKSAEPTIESAVQSAMSRLRYERERFEWQIRYARELVKLTPAAAGRWNRLIEEAEKAVVKRDWAGDAADLAKAVDEAEAILAPLAKEAKRRTVHVVAHSHIDMNWQWSWQETVATTCDTFGTVLRIMDMFPDMVFTQSQCSCYRICEEYEPELLRKIAVHVKSGRWESVASSWVEGDRNLVGAESLARHLLESRRYMKELFGLSPEDIPVDWSPDTFGFAATTPMYLAQGGIRYAYLHRPGGRTQPKAGMFWWVGPDGSRILTRNDMRCAYLGAPEPRKIVESLVRMETECGLPATMLLYGFGDHGGAPNIRHMRQLEAVCRWPIFPEIRCSTTREFFEKTERLVGHRLTEIRGELNAEFTGCYTSQSLIKRCNRYSEKRLQDVEAALVASDALAGHGGNSESQRECWRRTLFAHFHDILPGSGVHDTRTYTHGQFQDTMAATSREETLALRALAARINTAAVGASAPRPGTANPAEDHTGFAAGAGMGVTDGSLSQADNSDGRGGRVCVAFNPTPWPRDEVVEMVIWDDLYGRLGEPGARPPFSVSDASGRVVEAQVIEYREHYNHDYARIAFPVRVPAMGWTSVAIRESATSAVSGKGARPLAPPCHCSYALNERAPLGMENELVCVVFDPGTGGILRLTDKRTKTDLMAAEDRSVPNPLELIVEHNAQMTSWLIGHNGPPEQPRVAQVKTPLDGPHKASVEFSLSIRESEFVLTYELRAGDPSLYMRIAGTWFQRGSKQTGVPTLRAVFPTALRDARLRCEIPYGAISRDLKGGEEEPALRWAAVTGRTGSGKKAGLLLLNDSKHGHSIAGNALRLSLIRSSFDPDPLPEIGRHNIRLALRPFVGVLPDAEAVRAGECFEREIKLLNTVAHAGSLPVETGLVTVEPAGKVVLSAIKRAEGDAHGLVLRLFTTETMPVDARVRFNTALLGKLRSAETVDIMERPTGKGVKKPAVIGSSVDARIPAAGMVSLRVTFLR